MPVTRESVMEAILERKRYDGRPIVGVSHGPGQTEKALIIVDQRPFNIWIPLNEMDEEKFH